MFKSKTLAFALVTAIGAALAVVTASVAVNIVETRSLADVERQLRLTGYEWVAAEADGLTIRLSGEAADEATRFQALREVARVVDAGRLQDDITIHSPDAIEPPTFSIEILQNDDGISLIGLVPASTDIDAVAAAIAENSGGQPVSELVDQADYPAPDGWNLSVDFAVLTLSVLDRSKISVAAGQVDIIASASSEAERRQLDTKIRASASPEIAVNLQIAAPRPVVTPYTLRFVIEDGRAKFDACTTDTETGAAMLIAAANAAGLQGQQRCTVALGIPSQDWDEAAIMGITAVDEIGEGTLTMSDTDITLIGMHDTDPAAFDRITGALKESLPDVFSLTAEIADPPRSLSEGTSTAAPVFSATLSPEGLVQLRGPMPSERARLAATSLARAEFGASAVTDALRLRDDLPERWPVRVFAGLSALSQLRNGSLTIDGDSLRLTGSTGDEQTETQVTALLADKIGASEELIVDITYVEALDPLASIPEPQECVDMINEVIARQKITFAPGSADIDEEGRKAIAEIVEIMADCEHAPMEVAGHTDSQGREIMNKELSQARANAVVDALLARRVLTTNLIAFGYGEEQPIADNDTEEGREANRRIEFALQTIEADPEFIDEEAAASIAEADETAPDDAASDATETTGDDETPAPADDTAEPTDTAPDQEDAAQ